VRTRLISVIGSSTATPEEAALAEDVGRRVVEAGFGVVCGGRGGVMEAACRGAQMAGGVTVGVLPGESPEEGNSYLSIALPTGMGEARNVVVVRAGEAVIAVGGGLGTLSEIAHALRLGRRVVALASWEASLPDGTRLPVRRAATAAEAVTAALEGMA